MRADILIVGQGLAGTLLGWACERAGLSFALADNSGAAASRVAAGIINPIAGQRMVKSWRVDSLLPLARHTFRDLEAELGVPVWCEMRVRRWFANERERRIFAQKCASGQLTPFAGPADDDGFWIEGAARVDLPALLDAARTRWQAQGRWREAAVDLVEAAQFHDVVVDCTGLAGARSDLFGFVPWEFSKGEVLDLAVDDLPRGVVLNRGHWVLPLGSGMACVGATHEPGVVDPHVTTAARVALEASAWSLLGSRPFAVTGQRAGVRVNLPDKRPVVGRHPGNPRLAICNGLGAKGALVAPWLAAVMAQYLAKSTPVDPEVDVGRFWGSHSSHDSSQ